MSDAERLWAVRGAVKADKNDVEAILSATEALMRELMSRNELEPEQIVSCLFTATDDLNAEFPAVAARRLGLEAVPLLCTRELDVPGRDAQRDPRAGPLLRARRSCSRARLSGRGAGAAGGPPLRSVGPTASPPGHHNGQPMTSPSPRSSSACPTTRRGCTRTPPARRSAPRTSSSSPPTSRPGARIRPSIEADRRGGRGPQPLSRTSMRRGCAGGSPSASTPIRRGSRSGNGSCEILLAAAEALCEPGDELAVRVAVVLDLPAPRRALGGPRDPRAARRRLRSRPRRDARRGHRGDPAGLRLQSQQPHRHPPSGRADHGVLRAAAGPRHDRPRRGLRRVPDRRRPGRHRRPAGGVPEPGGRCGRSARCTAWPACDAATRSARRGSGRRSTRSASRSASTSWPRWPRPRPIVHADDVA